LNKNNHNNQTVTVHDVARVAGVSKSTVSLVLRGSDKASTRAKEKVLKAIQETGYVYNREAAAMRSKSSDLVAIVINDLTNPYSAKLAVALEKHIRELGFMATLVNTSENALTQTQIVSKLQEYRVRAFIICPTPNTQASWLNQLQKPQTQVVSIMRQVTNSQVPCVLPDNELGAYQATQSLINRGHKHIAFIGGDASISDYHQRLSGFNKAISERDDIQSWVFNSATNRHGGRMAMSECLAQVPNVESVMCFNDIVAYGVIEFLSEQGLKPGADIGVVGFDDLDDSKLMSIPLSTVKINADDIAKAVCYILKNNIQDGIQQVPIELIERAS
jgi:LacI family transcriptional regulator